MGQPSPRACQVSHRKWVTIFPLWRISLEIPSWNVIFLGRTLGSPPDGKILMCLFPFLIFLVNLSFPQNALSTSPNLEKASSTAGQLIHSGQNKVKNVGVLHCPQKSSDTDTLSETAQSTSLQHFKADSSDSKIKTNLCFEVL